MKRLIIVRHGKAEFFQIDKEDIDRKLVERGEKEVKELGNFLFTEKLIPDLIICSNAKRSRKTAKILSKKLTYPLEQIKIINSIYESGKENLFRIIAQIENQYSLVLLTGHNPGLEELILYLSDLEFFSLKTSGCVVIQFEIDDWNYVSAGLGKCILIKNGE